MHTTPGKNPPTLRDLPAKQHFMLRPMEKSDADYMADWYQQVEDVSIFDRQVPMPINHDEVLKIISTIISDREKEKCAWYIAESEKNEPVGMCGLESISLLHGNAILPVFVAKAWRHSGIGMRMACIMIDLAFNQLRLHRIATVYRADNKASEILTARCGFREEGIARQAWFSEGRHYDLVNVGLLADEWAEKRVELHNGMNPAISASLGPRPSEKWIWPNTARLD